MKSAILSRIANLHRPTTKKEATELVRKARKDGLSLPKGKQADLADQLLELVQDGHRVRRSRPGMNRLQKCTLAERFVAYKRTRDEFKRLLNRASSFSAIYSNSYGSYRLGNILVEIRHTCHEDWDAYSKSWHRSYGPKKTYSTTIVCTRWDRRSTVQKSYPQSKLQHMNKRAIEAVADFLGLPKQRGKQALRISPYVTLEPVESPHKRCKVFARKLAGELIGYVATRRNQHYHESHPNVACELVTRKIAQDRLRRQRKANFGGFDLGKPIGAILRGLGFCREGTADALDMLGLDDRRYDANELLDTVNLNAVPRVAKKYPEEVSAVASVLATIANLPNELKALI